MEKRRLGQTDLMVSEICLGTMTFGEQNTQEDAFAQMDYALDHGVNFVDTAELYAIPPRAETQGKTEEMLGNYFAARGNRQNVILATKVVGRSVNPWFRPWDGPATLSRKDIEFAIDHSLRRLQTDYIDLYQLHWPDRSANFFGKLGYEHTAAEDTVPLLETLTVLDDLIKAGKVRHVGLSNETPWGTMKFLSLAETQGLPRMVSIQNPYSLLNRAFEVGGAEIAHREQVGLLAYSPLAFGVLSGKYLNNTWPEGARLTLFKQMSRYNSPHVTEAVEKYVAIAHKYGLDPAQMALSYVTSRSFVTSNIIGATTMEQLQANIASSEITLSEEVLAEIEAVHQIYTYPAP